MTSVANGLRYEIVRFFIFADNAAKDSCYIYTDITTVTLPIASTILYTITSMAIVCYFITTIDFGHSQGV